MPRTRQYVEAALEWEAVASPSPFSRFALGRLHPLWWVPIALGFLAIDVLTGYSLPPPLYVPLIAAAAWYSGASSGMAVAVLLPLVRLAVGGFRDPLMTPGRLAISIAVLIFIAVVAGRLGDHERKLRERIRALESLLPMCMFCKSIRNARQEWQPLEAYMSDTGTGVTHGICPACASREGWTG